MNKKINVNIGDKFNDWTVIREVDGKYGRRFLCKSSRGVEKEVNLCHLRTGASMGHYGFGVNSSTRTHGMSKTRIWKIWMGMKARCNNRNVPAYHNYGGRGIRVCNRWAKFENFFNDMGNSYSDNLTIERIDVNKDYCKENCKWIVKSEQAKNKRGSRLIKYRGKNYNLSDLAKKMGLKYMTLYCRLYVYKIPVEDCLKQSNLKRRILSTKC